MTDHRTTEEIERQLERDREGLADSLDDLKNRFSVDAMVRQAADQLREHGGDLGSSVSRAAKENPLALTLTGVGLAWLIFGDRSNSSGNAPRRLHRHSDPAPYGSRQPDWSDDRAAHHPPADMFGSRPGMRAGSMTESDLPEWARHDHDLDHDDDLDHGDHSGGPGMGERARSAASGVGSRMSDASNSMREGARSTSENARRRANALRERLSRGTEQLSDEGRARVIAARERVHHARRRSMDRFQRGQDQASDMFERQPMIAGALALAIGAAIGAALPRTRFEDETMGEQSDALIHEAERIFEEERAKVGAVAGAAANEARNVAREAGSSAEDAARRAKSDADRNASGETAAQDVADKTQEKAREATQRVADAAKSEAEKQNLGKPRT